MRMSIDLEFAAVLGAEKYRIYFDAAQVAQVLVAGRQKIVVDVADLLYQVTYSTVNVVGLESGKSPITPWHATVTPTPPPSTAPIIHGSHIIV